MRSVVVTLSLVLVLAGTAAAQPGMTEPTPMPAQPMQPMQQPMPQGEQLSEGTALGLSLGGTIVSWVLVGVASGQNNQSSGSTETMGTIGAFGTMFAPSFGHWYAHSFATRGLGLRALGIGSALVGVMVALSECPLFSEGECHESGLAPVLLIAGAGLYIGGTIDDIATAPGKARRYNHRFENVSVVPVVRHDSGGFAVMGRF
jgi:hypothetical protein